MPRLRYVFKVYFTKQSEKALLRYSSRLKGLWQCNKKTGLRTKLRELNSVLSRKVKVPEMTALLNLSS